MSKKSEKRAHKKALAQQKFTENKARFVERVVIDHQPTQVVTPSVIIKPHLAPHLERDIAKTEKKPKVIQDGSRFCSRVTWCISRADRTEHWSWGESRNWEAHEWTLTIRPAFDSFEKLTWGEIDGLSSDTGHKLHHGHEIGDLIEEAQERWRYLNLEQYDSVFRFRLGNMPRAWGFIVQSHFYFVWWDRNHSIYPTN